jgi:hypothetical protein
MVQLAAALLTFGGVSPVWAIFVPPATVTETPQGNGSTEYNVSNTATNTFDISVFLSTTTGSSPTTTNADWTAEALNANLWVAPMGFPDQTTDVTWAEYTGLSYTQAFPGAPTKLNGYFLNFTFDSDTDTISYPGAPIIPGAGLDGFFFTGDPSSTYLVLGPADSSRDGTSSFTEGSVDTYGGTSTDLPEPTGIGLAVLGIIRIAHRRERRERGE